MKKSRVVIALLFPVWAAAGMNITANERVSVLLKPDVLRGSLSFEEQGKNQNTIKSDLNAIIAEVKRIDPSGRYCRGGGYRLSPRYNYKDHIPEFVGYSGTLMFACEFPGIENYNELAAAIDKVTVPAVRKNQGALEWGISSVQEADAQNRLRTELLRKAQTQAALFGKETGMACEVASVRFGGMPRVMPIMAKGMAMMASVPTESPIQSDEESAVEAVVDYNCSNSNRVP